MLRRLVREEAAQSAIECCLLLGLVAVAVWEVLAVCAYEPDYYGVISCGMTTAAT